MTGGETEAMLPQDIVRSLQNELSRYPAVLRAILFGSRAMGTHRPNSDIDLCLEAPDLKFQDFLRLASALDNLVLPYSLDLVLQHHIDNPELVNHIQRVGVVVYARS